MLKTRTDFSADAETTGSDDAERHTLIKRLRCNLSEMFKLGYPFNPKSLHSQRLDLHARLKYALGSEYDAASLLDGTEAALAAAESEFVGPPTHGVARLELVSEIRSLTSAAFPDAASVGVGSSAVGIEGRASDADICPG